MSHEIWSPRFIDTRSGRVFLTLQDEQWDANVRWDGNGRFGFSLRNYSRPGNLAAEVDLLQSTFRLVTPMGHPKPLDEIGKTVRKAFAWLEKEASKKASLPPIEPPRRMGWLLVLAGVMSLALLVIIVRFA